MTKEQLDNMPPLPDQLEALSRDKRDHIRIYALAYAEQQTAKIIEQRDIMITQCKHLEQQKAELLAEIAQWKENYTLIEKASSDNFALYYECKRDLHKATQMTDNMPPLLDQLIDTAQHELGWSDGRLLNAVRAYVDQQTGKMWNDIESARKDKRDAEQLVEVLHGEISLLKQYLDGSEQECAELRAELRGLKEDLCSECSYKLS